MSEINFCLHFLCCNTSSKPNFFSSKLASILDFQNSLSKVYGAAYGPGT
jgi:hypothetical protein